MNEVKLDLETYHKLQSYESVVKNGKLLKVYRWNGTWSNYNYLSLTESEAIEDAENLNKELLDKIEYLKSSIKKEVSNEIKSLSLIEFIKLKYFNK